MRFVPDCHLSGIVFLFLCPCGILICFLNQTNSGASACNGCPGGTYSASASSCVACAAGSFSPGLSSACSSCIAGTYQVKCLQDVIFENSLMATSARNCRDRAAVLSAVPVPPRPCRTRSRLEPALRALLACIPSRAQLRVLLVSLGHFRPPRLRHPVPNASRDTTRY